MARVAAPFAVWLAFAVAGCSRPTVERLGAVPLTRLDGTRTDLASWRGVPLVINIWQQSCVPCAAELPALEQVHHELGGRVRFVGVASQDDAGKVRDFAAKAGITYDLLLDPDGDLFVRLNLASIPTTVFVDAGGRVVGSHTGALTADGLRAAIGDELGVTV